MDGVSSASSVIAIVELSAKVASLLLQYSTAVKHAKDDIQRLSRELEPLSETLEGVRRLLDGPGGAKLETIQRFRGSLEGCASQLADLELRLAETLRGKHGNDSKSVRLMSRFGVRALKWPFESKEIESIIKRLERYRDSLAAALMVQTVQILSTTQNDVLSKLPNVASASFDSHANEHGAQCHSQTRVEIRCEILEWADKPDGKCIYWLNGMAGTGKSTISRTVAKMFSDKKYLGGSFFFKRGERDRGNASQLFTTIAHQLVVKEPKLATSVAAALDQDTTLPSKSLAEQFEKLILKPLEGLKDTYTLVFVLDALDECEGDEDVRRIIHLISKGSQLRSIRLRAFLTSRPELPIRLGFKEIQGSYQDLVLHQLPSQVIISDITHFLNSELLKIKKNHNSLLPGTPLPHDWPGSEAVQDLAHMAIPLFVFAATACRFISDPVWSDPDGQLRKFLEYRSQDNSSDFDNLDATYRPVLDRLTAGSGTPHQSLIDEFQLVVGSIILLEEPLSALSLSKLLGVPRSIIDRRVMSFHSVLHVPTTDDPIRILHLSFRDFLIDPQKRDTNRFWIDERGVHKRLALSCLRVLSAHPHFHKDVCGLQHPGSRREDIPLSVIRSKLPSAVRYACIYWAEHVVKGEMELLDDLEVHDFLQQHFVHWLEALSLLDKVPESASMIRKLQSMKVGDKAAEFLYDAERFISTFMHIIAKHPLQIYSSGLIFAPQMSVIKRKFQHELPKWIRKLPPVRQRWSKCLYTLEGYKGNLNNMCFTPDGKTILSSTYSGEIRSWDVYTGVENEFNCANIDSPLGALSPDGRIIASVSASMTGISLFDNISGEIIRTFSLDVRLLSLRLNRLLSLRLNLQFTSDSQRIFLAQRNGDLKTLNIVTGEETLIIHLSVYSDDYGDEAILSPQEDLIATISDGKLALWSVETGQQALKIDAHEKRLHGVAFSPSGGSIAAADESGAVCMWDVYSGVQQLRLQATSATETPSGEFAYFKFSTDGKMFATASSNDLKLWDTRTGSMISVIRGHSDLITHIAFSPNGERIASSEYDGTIRIWDAVQSAAGAGDVQPGPWLNVWQISFSPDGQAVHALRDRSDGRYFITTNVLGLAIDEVKITPAAGSSTVLSPYSDFSVMMPYVGGDKVQVVLNKNLRTATTTHLSHCRPNMNDLHISPDGSFVVNVNEDTDNIALFDAVSGKQINTLKSPIKNVCGDLVAVSANYRLVAFASSHSVHIWDIYTGEVRDVSPKDIWIDRTGSVAISPSGDKIVAVCEGGQSSTFVGAWDATAGAQVQHLIDNPDPGIRFTSFTPDGRYLWTDLGFLSLDPHAVDPSVQRDNSNLCLFVDGNWIKQAGEKMLWIPPDYRPSVQAVSENTVILISDGNWMPIQFSNEL